MRVRETYTFATDIHILIQYLSLVLNGLQ